MKFGRWGSDEDNKYLLMNGILESRRGCSMNRYHPYDMKGYKREIKDS